MPTKGNESQCETAEPKTCPTCHGEGIIRIEAGHVPNKAEEIRDLALKFGRYPDREEFEDWLGCPDKYPALRSDFTWDCPSEPTDEDGTWHRFAVKIWDWVWGCPGDASLPATVFRYPYRVDVQVTGENGQEYIERRWANDWTTLQSGGCDEKKVWSVEKYRREGNDGRLLGKILQAGWTWEDRATFPESKRSVEACLDDIRGVIHDLIDVAFSKRNAYPLIGLTKRLDELVWEGFGAEEGERQRVEERATSEWPYRVDG